VVDVAPADPDVAERPPAVADPPGGQPDDRERAEKAGQQVEEHRFAARRRFVAADGDADGVERRGRRDLDQAFVVGGLVGAAAQHASELAGDDDPRADDRDPGEGDGRALRSRPAKSRPRPGAPAHTGR
jgi:hypothetical protein